MIIVKEIRKIFGEILQEDETKQEGVFTKHSLLFGFKMHFQQNMLVR